jgi:hypothetical protein
MARYKYTTHLHAFDSPVFDAPFHPGDIVPVSGIYRCTGCGREDACNSGDPFPTQNHAQHLPTQGIIQWQLVVGTN